LKLHSKVFLLAHVVSGTDCGRRKLLDAVSKLNIHATDIQVRQLIEISQSLTRRTVAWYASQNQHMPAVESLRGQNPSRSLSIVRAHIDAFDLQLWLPSDIREHIEIDGHLVLCEWELRKVQADEALASIRDALSVQYSVKQGKIAYGQGVKAATSSTHKIEESRKRAEFHAETYRKARGAMMNLLPRLPSHLIANDVLKLFPPLSSTDIRPLPSAELKVGEGRKRVELSWIWKSYGSAGGDQECVNDGKHGKVPMGADQENFIVVRLQWLRSRARASRWEEEVRLVSEEMRRVSKFLEYERDRWLGEAKRRNVEAMAGHTQSPLMEGLMAYAYRQAELRDRLRCHFDYLWRHADRWKQDPAGVPTFRHWYSSVVEPDKSPYLYIMD
jgi:hypothetical protein